MEIQDLQELFDEANESGKKADQLSFLWKIMKSSYTQYHYSLIRDDNTSDQFRNILWSRFEEHGEESEALLLAVLANNEDQELHADIIFRLGIIIDKDRGTRKDEVLAYARKFVLSENSLLRSQAIVVLGWIGSNEEIPLLEDRLINDNNSECRAWSASCFMQMESRSQRRNIPFDSKTVINAIHKALRKEADDFVKGVCVLSLQELMKIDFNLSDSIVEKRDSIKIDRSVEKALDVLSQL